MKNIAFVIILFFQFTLFGQFEIDRFSLLENNVKILKLSKHEFYKYKFEDNLIIEEDNLVQFEGKLIRNYYYSEINRPDSIETLEIYEDTTYRSLKLYTYFDNGNLKKIQSERKYDWNESLIFIDSFNYDTFNRIDTIFHFSNKVETIFGTKRTDKLRLCSSTKYFYNDNSQKIKETSNSYGEPDSTLYSYDTIGKLIKRIEFYGKIVTGCKVSENETTSITTYSYNQVGLIEKIKDYFLYQYPNGKKRRVNSFTIRRKYKYYKSEKR